MEPLQIENKKLTTKLKIKDEIIQLLFSKLYDLNYDGTDLNGYLYHKGYCGSCLNSLKNCICCEQCHNLIAECDCKRCSVCTFLLENCKCDRCCTCFDLLESKDTCPGCKKKQNQCLCCFDCREKSAKENKQVECKCSRCAKCGHVQTHCLCCTNCGKPRTWENDHDVIIKCTLCQECFNINK